MGVCAMFFFICKAAIAMLLFAFAIGILKFAGEVITRP